MLQSESSKKHHNHGKLNNIQQILDKNKEEVNKDKEEAKKNSKSESKSTKTLLSAAHLQRINKIYGKFKRKDVMMHHAHTERDGSGSPTKPNPLMNNLMVLAPEATEVPLDKKWLNYQRYEAPIMNQYPRNPFSTDRHSNNVPHSLLPGAFHVGIKFSGKPHEMLKLVCLTLIKIEIEWQFDSKEMKLKCRTKVDDEKLVDDDKFIEDFIRQQFLKFYIHIDKIVKNGPNLQSSKRSRGPPAAQT